MANENKSQIQDEATFRARYDELMKEFHKESEFIKLEDGESIDLVFNFISPKTKKVLVKGKDKDNKAYETERANYAVVTPKNEEKIFACSLNDGKRLLKIWNQWKNEYINVTRTGTGMSTHYDFVPIPKQINR